MTKYIQVFDLFLQPHDQFIFYARGEEKILTSTSDLQHPYPSYVSRIWNSENQTWDRNPEPFPPDKVAVPTYGVKKGNLNLFLKENAVEGVKDAIKRDIGEFNLFLPRRDMSQDLVQVGLFVRDAVGELRNLEVEDYLNRMMQLKAFW